MKAAETSNDYRADIDGLRAIAVLSVIVFHINESWLPGGFVGVDIFFVISGYLISLHLFKDFHKERFSLAEFYRRRIKRIAPAMLVVVLTTVLLAQFLYRPSDAEKVAESGLWSLLSLSNIYFWLFQDTSYFAAASNELPLLHLWSLGVEEQFYIFWPLILLITYKAGHGRYFFLGILLVAVASFLLGQYLFEADPSFVYYMLPTRAGELLMGALLAHWVFKRGHLAVPGFLVPLSAWTGSLLVLGSLVLLSEKLVFPGLWAIPPTLGAAMLIFAGHYGKSEPSRLLMQKPMVWVGLISYSAYLWHWPVLALLRYSNIDINLVWGGASFVLTLVLAWGSYRYVEIPVRRSSGGAVKIFLRQYMVPCGAIAFLALAFMKLDGYGLRWWSEDYKSALVELRDQTKPAYKYDYVCQSQRVTNKEADNPDCVVGDKNQSVPNVILWGDSNAAHYVGMVGVFAQKAGFRFRNLQIGSCPPMASDPEKFVELKRLMDCRDSQQVMLDVVDKYDVVIISASWTSYQSRSENFLNEFFETARILANKGKLVVLIGKIPVIETYDRLCREKAISLPFMKCDQSSVPLPQEVADINNRLKQFSQETKNVEYYEITRYLCEDNACSAFNIKGHPIYYDSNHLTLGASWEIGSEIYKKEGVPFPFSLIPRWSNALLSMNFNE